MADVEFGIPRFLDGIPVFEQRLHWGRFRVYNWSNHPLHTKRARGKTTLGDGAHRFQIPAIGFILLAKETETEPQFPIRSGSEA